MFAELVTIAVFLAIVLVVTIFVELFQRRDEEMRPTLAEVPLVESKGASAATRGWTRSILVAAASIIPQRSGQLEAVSRDLKRAGHYQRDALVEFLAFRNVLVVGMLCLFGVLALLADPSSRLPLGLAGIGAATAILGYGLPRLVLAQQASRRVRRIERGLPDALDLISMCLSGGLTLLESMERVGRELQEPRPDVAVEFEIIRRQADADSMAVAVRNFSDRIDLADARALAAIVSQTEQLGTSVSTAISEFSDSVRLQHRQRAEERAGRTSIQLLFPVIVCLAPPIFVILCGPPILKLSEFVRRAHAPGGPLDPGALSRPEPLNFDDPYFGKPTERLGGGPATRFRAAAQEDE